MTQKPHLNFWQIWNMCFGFMGIQFGFALQNSNVSRIFQTLGAEIDELPILWVAAPITGLLVQPIIGYMSDRTWNRMGRRRPYFLVGALLASVALFFMPNSPALWVAAGMLWIMDASINVSMEPFRAFVGDMLPEKQRTLGFAMQTFFIGVGSVAASALPWMMTNWFDISNVAEKGVIPESVKFSFYAGGAALLLCVLWTIYRTKEYSPEELDAFNQADAATSKAHSAIQAGARSASQYFKGGLVWLLLGLALSAGVFNWALDKELYVLTFGAAVFGGIQIMAGNFIVRDTTDNGFSHIVSDLFHMPTAMKQLATVQFFSWFAMFSIWAYTTPAITAFHYGSSDPTSLAYNEGADWVGILFATYNVCTIFAAIFIAKFSETLGRRRTHLVNMCFGGLGLISIYFVTDPRLLVFSMIGVGFAWASILSIPYSLLSSSVPHQKMGTYMGIFNFFIVIPQILAATILGILVREIFGGEAIYALMLGGVSMILAGISTLYVTPKKDA